MTVSNGASRGGGLVASRRANVVKLAVRAGKFGCTAANVVAGAPNAVVKLAVRADKLAARQRTLSQARQMGNPEAGHSVQ